MASWLCKPYLSCLLFSALIAKVFAGKWCTLDNSFGIPTFCPHGCCISKCCPEIDVSLNESTFWIIGGCVGSVMIIILVVLVARACCKSGGQSGNVVAIAPIPVSGVVHQVSHVSPAVVPLPYYQTHPNGFAGPSQPAMPPPSY